MHQLVEFRHWFHNFQFFQGSVFIFQDEVVYVLNIQKGNEGYSKSITNNYTTEADAS